MKIFYSWQASLSDKTNRALIERALIDAAKHCSEMFDVEPVIDRDTVGTAGHSSQAATPTAKQPSPKPSPKQQHSKRLSSPTAP